MAKNLEDTLVEACEAADALRMELLRLEYLEPNEELYDESFYPVHSLLQALRAKLWEEQERARMET